MQLVTTSCFLNRESSHSLAIISWSVCFVCISVSVYVLWVNANWGGVHFLQRAITASLYSMWCTFFSCKYILTFWRVCFCACSDANLWADVASYEWLCLWKNGVKEQNECHFSSEGHVLKLLCLNRCQETDASFTFLPSYCNLPAQLNGNMWALLSHCLLVYASCLRALSTISSASRTSHRLTTAIPHFLRKLRPMSNVVFKIRD